MKLKTKISDRIIVFVKYPLSMTGNDYMRLLNWAKANKPITIYDSFIVQCWVKPWYMKHFEKDNKKYMIPHKQIIGEFTGWEIMVSLDSIEVIID